jgi:hypothetical protein
MANPHFTFGLVKKILMRASKSLNIPYLHKKQLGRENHNGQYSNSKTEFKKAT